MTDQTKKTLKEAGAQLEDEQLDEGAGGGFSELQGITTEVDVIEFQDGEDLVLPKSPGRPKS